MCLREHNAPQATDKRAVFSNAHSQRECSVRRAARSRGGSQRAASRSRQPEPQGSSRSSQHSRSHSWGPDCAGQRCSGLRPPGPAQALEARTRARARAPLEKSRLQMVRSEHDLLGDRDLPDDAYYGIQTLRAVENYQVTDIPISHFPNFPIALAMVKKAAALANAELQLIPPDVGAAIVSACDDIIAGELLDEFVVDMIQGGAGTSTNMNANEVIANRALEHLGEPKGNYTRVHPNDHVNRSQSTNDAYPTAVKMAVLLEHRSLQREMRELVGTFRRKGAEFADVLKMGRTQLQDAVPMTLGQEFNSFASTIAADLQFLESVASRFYTVNMGGTAIGTGIAATTGYARACVRHLRAVTGLPIVAAEDLIEETANTGGFLAFSGVLRRIAVKVSKICNDLRLLSSGPRAGFNEINLPAMAPGSSIMPGKVNPVIPETVNQIAFQVVGQDLTVTMASESGQLQLNVFEPVMAYAILTSLQLLTRGYQMLREKCVEGITANEDVAMGMVTNSIGIVTALLPFIGYANASEAAKVALAENKGVAEVVVELGYLNQEQVDTLMRPAAMTQPQEDAGGEPAASSVDVVGGGQYSGYHAWQANKDISGLWSNVAEPEKKSKL